MHHWSDDTMYIILYLIIFNLILFIRSIIPLFDSIIPLFNRVHLNICISMVQISCLENITSIS